MNTQKIVVIGSSNTDMVIKTGHLPLPGETVLGGDFSMHPGGKGANQAVAAARLGGDVIFVARVGDDLFGQQALEGFQRHGIDTRYVTKDPNSSSGIALIMVDEKGENSIAVALGANQGLDIKQLDPLIPELQNSAFVLTQLETPLSTIEYLGKLAVQRGFRLVLNPAPAQILPDALLAALYMITPNAIETELLTGIKVTDEASARAAAHALRAKGVAIAIITMGGQGAYICADDYDELIPSIKVKVVDTTAAGDTFNGALLVALAEGRNLKAATEFANRAAAYSVGILGAQASAPTRTDIDHL